MKNKEKKIIILISIVSFLIVLITISLIGIADSKKILKYDDLNLYKSNNYELLNNNDIYKRTSNNCKLFIPEYNDFEYSQFANGFYIFDGTNTLTYTSVSFVLELQFNTTQEYEQFILYEHDRCEYTNKYNIIYHGYECFVTVDENYTYFYYEKDIPYQFGLLCENKNNLMIRYVYFRECESSLEEQFDVVFKNTNCDW